MNKYIAGIVAGFVATAVLSLLLVVKAHMGIMPHLNVVRDLALLAGQQHFMATGWLVHFVLGSVVWGILYATFEPILRGGSVGKGISFSIIIWLMMMVIYMPLVGAGFFGLKMGLMAIGATLVLHLVYGSVLGFVFGRLHRELR